VATMKIQIGDEVRDMTADEQANYDAVLVEQTDITQTIIDKAAAKESAKAKLAALGLTEEEVNAIIGGV